MTAYRRDEDVVLKCHPQGVTMGRYSRLAPRRRMSDLKLSERVCLRRLVHARTLATEWLQDAEQVRWTKRDSIASLKKWSVALQAQADQMTRMARSMAETAAQLEGTIAETAMRQELAATMQGRSIDAIDSELRRLGLPYEGSEPAPAGWQGYTPDSIDLEQGMDDLESLFPLLAPAVS